MKGDFEMPKSVVSIVKGQDPERMVEEALSLLGGVASLIKPNSVVVIKPNSGHPFPAETSVNTSPAMVTAVINVIRKAKPKEIIVAEAAALGCDTMECFKISGIGKAASDAGVDRIIDIKKEQDLISIPIRDARSAMTRVLLPRFLVEADHIVNVPIFKTHTTMVFTCALKNLKGVVQDKVHYQMHQTILSDAMMDLCSVVRADLNIVDLIYPGEGFGPHHTVPVDFGCVVAGRDPVAVDSTVCRMVGLDINKVPYFEAAREHGIGNFVEELIEVRGRKIDEVYKKLWIPYLGGFGQWPEYNILAQRGCSSCQGLIGFTLEKLKAINEYDKHAGIAIVAGARQKIPEGVPKENLLLLGDCTKRHREKGIFCGGCPPAENYLLWCIQNRQDIEKRVRTARTQESEAAVTRAFVEYVKKIRQGIDAEVKK
jgi:uncharacterized protein (DUF362 family)